jgi:hypothetical protein
VRRSSFRQRGEDARQQRPRDSASSVFRQNADEAQARAGGVVPHADDPHVLTRSALERNQVRRRIEGGRSERLVVEGARLPPPTVATRDVLPQCVVQESEPLGHDFVGTEDVVASR